MATVQSYTKAGVDRKFQARSPVTLAYAGTGTPELAAFPDAKSGDVIEREGDRARWRVVGNQLFAIPGGVTSVNGKSGEVSLSAQDVGAASSSHTHTKSQITDLETISTSIAGHTIVKRTTSGDITVPTTPSGNASATSKSYVDTQINTRAASSHTHTKSQITDLEVISTNATVNHIVKRTTSGNITVPTTPNANTSAVSKKYVDDALADAAVGDHQHDIADINLLQDELDKKAEKTYVDDQINTRAPSSHTHTKSDITDLEIVSPNVTVNHIVKRTSGGNIYVPTSPISSTAATSRSYVDSQISTRAASSHTHTKTQITDLEPISTDVTANHVVKRTTSGNISVPTTPSGNASATSKSYVDTQINTRAASSHTHTKSQITDLETISTGATANHIVKRTTSGNITVPTTPNANTSAASKSYVDTEVGKKANTSHTHTKSQITDLETISTTATVNHVVKRTTSGNITVPTTPNANTSAASKQYVDNTTPWVGTRNQYDALGSWDPNRLYVITGVV